MFKVFHLQEGETIVIADAGVLGLSTVMAAKASGAGTIVAIDRHRNRLELAQNYGATAVLNLPPGELAAAIPA